QVQGLRDPPGPRIGQTQIGHYAMQIERDVRGTTLGEGVFEHEDSMLEISFTEGNQAQSVLRHDRAGEVTSRFGNPGRLLAVGDTLGKRSHFCTALQQPETVARGANHHAAEAFMARLTFVGRYGLPEHVYSATVVPQGEVNRTQVAIH